MKLDAKSTFLIIFMGFFIFAVWQFYHRGIFLQKVPVPFYSTFVDQDNRPVSSTKILVRLTSVPGIWQYESEQMTVETDEQGTLRIEGKYAQYLDIVRILDERYLFKGAEFRYVGDPQFRYYPDAKHPVKLHLWKKTAPTPLLKHSLGVYLISDGRLYGYNLEEAELHDPPEDSDDLILTVKVPAKLAYDHHYPWSAVIRVPSGGLVETNDTFLYRAPQSGYVPEWKLDRSGEDPNWISPVNPKFYVKSRNGKLFSSIATEVQPGGFGGKAQVSLKYLVNTAGSPNLEPVGEW